ncbi:MAG TPA: hypothetical protein VHZ96_26290 [Frankiaceae bacterium]|jgi:hypothetical protein|nr:hypothetical protein [Frankiaceae bacterium]
MDDSMHDHPKVEHLSLAALGLWTKCWSKALRQCKTAPVPGFVSEATARSFAGPQTKRLAAELSTPIPGKKFGLWEPVEGGWMIHDFADYLPKQRDPEEAAESGRKGAQARLAKQAQQRANSQGSSHAGASQQPELEPSSEPSDSRANGQAGAEANDGSRASRSAYPSRPVPKDQDQDLGGDRQETLQPAAATKHPPDHDPPTSPANARCTAHRGIADPGPCNGCRVAREQAERRADAALEQAAREHEARRIACTRCDGTWIVDDQQRPTRRKCDHRRSA